MFRDLFGQTYQSIKWSTAKFWHIDWKSLIFVFNTFSTQYIFSALFLLSFHNNCDLLIKMLASIAWSSTWNMFWMCLYKSYQYQIFDKCANITIQIIQLCLNKINEIIFEMDLKKTPIIHFWSHLLQLNWQSVHKNIEFDH